MTIPTHDPYDYIIVDWCAAGRCAALIASIPAVRALEVK